MNGTDREEFHECGDPGPKLDPGYRLAVIESLTAAGLEGWHDLFGNPLDLIEHRGFGRADRVAEADVLHPRVALFEALEQLDELSRRAGEPGAEVHVVLDRRHAGSGPTTATCHRRTLSRRQPRDESERREHFHVLFVDRGDLADR